MDSDEPHKLTVHTGDELAAQLASEKQADQRQADRIRMEQEAAAAKRKANLPRRSRSVEIFKLLLAAMDLAIYLTLVAAVKASPSKDGIVVMLKLLALGALAIAMIVLFFVQATVASYLQKWSWPFWAIVVGTVLGSPLLALLVFQLIKILLLLRN